MDLKKKIIISLVSFWGIGIILALVFAGVLILQKNLTIPRVQASPGPACTVNDDLEVTGTLDGGSSNVCEIVTSSDGDTEDLPNYGSRIAFVDCPSRRRLTGGGCRCEEKDLDEVVLQYSYPFGSGWDCRCVRISGSGNIKIDAFAVCCF